MESGTRNTPLIMLVDDQEWTSRSIESILRPRGHAVVKAYTGQQALDLVAKLDPDAILVDFHLPDLDGIDVARECRESPTVSPSTPILMMTNGDVTRAQRLEALGSGVWDILRHPVDPNELILRIGNFIQVKQSTDRIREEGLTDPQTGFYNARGLLRRMREISADSRRLERSVACLALGGDLFAQDPVDPAELEGPLRPDDRELMRALHAITRESDTVGRLPSGEFIVVALGTDETGAEQLFERLTGFIAERSEAARATPEGVLPLRLRAGSYAPPGGDTMPPAEEILLRATRALRRAQAEETEGPFRVRSYRA